MMLNRITDGGMASTK